MADLGDLLRGAAPSPRRALDIDTVRNRARRHKQRRVAARFGSVLLVVGLVAAVAIAGLDRESGTAADETVLVCSVSLGEAQTSGTMATSVGSELYLRIEPYTVHFEIGTEPGRGRVIRATTYGPSQPGATGVNPPPDLPPRQILSVQADLHGGDPPDRAVETEVPKVVSFHDELGFAEPFGGQCSER